MLQIKSNRFFFVINSRQPAMRPSRSAPVVRSECAPLWRTALCSLFSVPYSVVILPLLHPVINHSSSFPNHRLFIPTTIAESHLVITDENLSDRFILNCRFASTMCIPKWGNRSAGSFIFHPDTSYWVSLCPAWFCRRVPMHSPM